MGNTKQYSKYKVLLKQHTQITTFLMVLKRRISKQNSSESNINLFIIGENILVLHNVYKIFVLNRILLLFPTKLHLHTIPYHIY